MWDRSAGHRRRCPWKHSLAVLQRRVLPAPVPSPKPAGCLAGASEGLIPNPLMPWELGFGLTSAAGPEPAPIPAPLIGEAARIHLERGTWRGAPQPLHASWGAGTRAARSRGGFCCSTPGSRRMLPRDIPGWWRKSPPLPPSPFPSHHQSSLAALSCGLSHILITTKKKKRKKNTVVIIIIIIIIADACTVPCAEQRTRGWPYLSSETCKQFLNCMDVQVARKANDYK